MEKAFIGYVCCLIPLYMYVFAYNKIYIYNKNVRTLYDINISWKKVIFSRTRSSWSAACKQNFKCKHHNKGKLKKKLLKYEKINSFIVIPNHTLLFFRRLKNYLATVIVQILSQCHVKY